ncbi:HAD-IA family hydrolase [Patulibacter minatonensis]|uniref:HAD-IA family hydrolase n=1 Tax=Patulibacter minatonensis TaxID=298163 RepID=UPI00047D49DB|nr:HAD-IA family hydrolase [Patulibacter minatonensis]
MTAILFGSISTIADTSELQRDAFNRAFEEHGLDWNWSRVEYVELLQKNGGKQRIAEQAEASGEDVDAEAVHATKSRIFQEALADAELSPRAGVVETIREGRDAGYKIALVTTTSAENVDALVQGLAGTVDRSDFDLVVDAGSVERPKPDESAYLFALSTLGEDASGCVAIEDNVGGVASARAASVAVAAFPNANTAGHDFEAADGRVDELSLPALRALIPVA